MVIFGVIAVGFIIINVVTNGALSPITQIPLTMIANVRSASIQLTQLITVELTPKQVLVSENKALKKNVATLELYALNNKLLADENVRLRALLKNVKSDTQPVYLARVSTYAGSFPKGEVIIHKSKNVEYRVGALVLQRQRIYIGKIIEQRKNTAVVRLASAYGENTGATVGTGEQSTYITLQGAGSGNMVAEVAREVPLLAGDPVAYYGGDRILVGYIDAIDKKPTDALQKIYVRTPVNTHTMQFVLVEK